MVGDVSIHNIIVNQRFQEVVVMSINTNARIGNCIDIIGGPEGSGHMRVRQRQSWVVQGH